MGDALHLAGDALVQRVLRVERIQDGGRALHGVDAAGGDGGVGHLAVYRHVQLQATVVRGDHLVAKACGNHQIGLEQLVLQQPGGADFAAKFFVVSEDEFYAALAGFGHSLQCPGGKGEGGKIALAHGRCATVNFAALDFAAIGVFAPALAGGHHIAMGVHGHGDSACAIGAARDEVGDGLQARSLHQGLRHFMLFHRNTHGLDQLGRVQGVGRVVARWSVGGHLNEGLHKAHLLVKMRVDPGVELLVRGVHWGHGGQA